MKKTIIDIMFMLCFSSPILLVSALRGKDVFFPEVAGNRWAVILFLYLPILGVLGLFEDMKIDAGILIRGLYGIITFCIGVFLIFTLSWWYILVLVYAFVFLFLLGSEKFDSKNNASH